MTFVRREHALGVVTDLVTDLVRWARGLRDAHSPTAGMPHWESMHSATMRHLTAIDRLEAAVRADRRELAGTWLDEMSAYADGSGAPWALAAVAHGRGLLAEGAAAEDSFRKALEFHGSSLRAPDRAKTELALGSFLRRSRRRVEARQPCARHWRCSRRSAPRRGPSAPGRSCARRGRRLGAGTSTTRRC